MHVAFAPVEAFTLIVDSSMTKLTPFCIVLSHTAAPVPSQSIYSCSNPVKELRHFPEDKPLQLTYGKLKSVPSATLLVVVNLLSH